MVEDPIFEDLLACCVTDVVLIDMTFTRSNVPWMPLGRLKLQEVKKLIDMDMDWSTEVGVTKDIISNVLDHNWELALQHPKSLALLLLRQNPTTMMKNPRRSR